MAIVGNKQLGQVFTGQHLSKLLASLAKAEIAMSVIDPMCGTGDMLNAVYELNPKAKIVGIEIDRRVLKEAENSIKSPNLELIAGNAFSKDILLKLKNRFDLVITNPPYVRYQTTSKNNDVNGIPSAQTIRKDLLTSTSFLLRDNTDRQLFSEIIRSYSGLSDIAVPSWILSAMLTKVGGTLALVVPESWLSRDYAQIIQYLLLRWFDIKFIVEDANAAWFKGVLVKTNLIVAQRVERQESIYTFKNKVYAHIKLSGKSITNKSIVGNIYPHNTKPEQVFANNSYKLLSSRLNKEDKLWSFEIFSFSDLSINLKFNSDKSNWLRKCESKYYNQKNSIVLPLPIRKILNGNILKITTLDQLGVEVGQGLRTGANLFFYVDLIKNGGSKSTILPNKIFKTGEITIPSSILKPVLRKQSELSKDYQVDRNNLSGRVLIIPTNIQDEELLKLISIAEKTKKGEKYIPELSAVKTNIRSGNNCWYVLPPLALRHLPQLLIPRVNNKTPRTYLNCSNLIVDANFSTVWLKPYSILTPFSLLALLNSSWSRALMESTGAVMGGGALKLEATHLKKFPIPVLSRQDIEMLDHLGRQLILTPNQEIMYKINKRVLAILFKEGELSKKLEQFEGFILKKFSERMVRI